MSRLERFEGLGPSPAPRDTPRTDGPPVEGLGGSRCRYSPVPGCHATPQMVIVGGVLKLTVWRG
jgi:hypothetical protein